MLVYYTYRNKNKSTKSYISKPLDLSEFLLSKGTKGQQEITKINNAEYITKQTNKDTLSKSLKDRLNKSTEYLHRVLNEEYHKLQNSLQFPTMKDECYIPFKIPKKKLDESGKVQYRHLVAVTPVLKHSQLSIANAISAVGFLAHNAAHGFVKERSSYTNALFHKSSKHILKFDLSHFFDSVSPEILRETLPKLLYFSNLSEQDLDYLIEIATFKNALPQGSPLSPILTNCIMLPFDYTLHLALQELPIHCTYTRYVDDITISSKKTLNEHQIKSIIVKTLNLFFNNKIRLNEEKTQSLIPGKCYITGVKLNDKQNLTLGWDKKRQIKIQLNVAIQKKFDNTLTLQEAQQLVGYISYMGSIEPGYTKYLIRKYETKYAIINIPKFLTTF